VHMEIATLFIGFKQAQERSLRGYSWRPLNLLPNKRITVTCRSQRLS
jgi:hypothetical protein